MRRAAKTPSRQADAIKAVRPAGHHLGSTGFAILDQDLRFAHANDVIERLAGCPLALLVGRRVDEVFTDAPRKVAVALDRLLAGRKRTVVLSLSRPPPSGLDGHRRLWRLTFRGERNAGGRPTAISVTATEVTALRRARERSRLQFAFQELLIQITSGFVNIPADRVDGRIRDGLRQLAAFLHSDRALLTQTNAQGKLVITHLYSVATFPEIPHLVVDEAFPWLAGLIRRGEVLRICDGPSEVPAGAVRERAWMAKTGARAHLTIPFSVGGMPLCALSLTSKRPQAWPPEFIPRLRLAATIFVNALLRKQADEDLQRTRESLAHMSRVQTMGEMAASIAHEVNQPVCAMITNAQAAQRLLGMSQPDLAEVSAALSDIVADGLRAGAVIGRTRDMLRQHDVRFDLQGVNELIRRVAPDLRNYAMLRHVVLDVDLAADLPRVLGHGVQIQQVVTNLLVNAIDAVPHDRVSDGRVVVATRFDPRAGAVEVRVTDNGVGLPPGDIEQVFQPFYTSKPSGLGMGLPISRTIVEAHAGRLWAERNAAAGATFHFSLPVPPDQRPDARRKADAAADPR